MRNMETLYKVKEVASILKVSVHTVRYWVLNKKIKFIKIKKSVRIPQSELDRLMKGE